MRLSRLGALLLIAAPAHALAQEPPPPPPAEGTDVAPASGMQSVLPNMLSTEKGAVIDFRADYSNFSDSLFGDLTLIGFNLHGQYLTPQGYGGYASLPYYYASGDSDSDNGAGNIELGGLYAIPQGTGEILLRGGLALDTAGSVGGIFTPFSQIGPRLADAYPTGFSATWLRAHGTYRHAAGNLRIAASGGADVPLGSDDIDIDAILRLAVSFGIETPGFGVGVGLAALHAVGAPDGSDDNTITSLNVNADFPASPTMRVYASFGYPDLENDSDLDVWAIGAGLRVWIP